MAETRKHSVNPALALLAAAAGWLVPGLGHALLHKWAKAIVCFCAVGSLALIGLWMRGNVFSSNAADAFGTLGFLADVGGGLFYFLAGVINPAGGDVSRSAGDYGTRLIATAGVLNLLFVLEVLQIGFGSKEEGHTVG